MNSLNIHVLIIWTFIQNDLSQHFITIVQRVAWFVDTFLCSLFVVVWLIRETSKVTTVSDLSRHVKECLKCKIETALHHCFAKCCLGLLGNGDLKTLPNLPKTRSLSPRCDYNYWLILINEVWNSLWTNLCFIICYTKKSSTIRSN